jgi:glycosyltransferase involved in cell wall biosynthesis
MVQTKLCVVTHTFLPHVGGIERVVYEQCKRLMQKKRFEPMVLTHQNYTAKSYVFDGISVRCYDSLNIGFRLGIPYAIPQVNSFKTFLETIKANDLIHVHGHPYLSSFLAAKIAKRYAKPLVLTQHNTFIEYNNIFDTVEKLNDLAVGKQVLKEADKIIVVSNATRNYVLSLGADPAKIEVLHNGVDLERFKPLPDVKGEMRKKLGIPEEACVVLTVRRLVYKNGIDTLLDSAEIAVKKNPKLVFVVVGRGPDFEEVKEKIAQLGMQRNFRLTGFVSDEDLPFYYNVADLFALPSKSGEGLPLVALEAMACGLPVIATDVGGTSEILSGEYGKLVPPNSPNSLAEAILEFSCKNLAALKNELRTMMEQKYSWDRNVEKLGKIYEELI